MEPQEIWGLILRADRIVKHKGDAGRERAVHWLRQARVHAVAIGHAALAEQATVRLADLGADEDAS